MFYLAKTNCKLDSVMKYKVVLHFTDHFHCAIDIDCNNLQAKALMIDNPILLFIDK